MELFRQLVHGRTDGRTLLVPKVAIATENSQKISEKNESRSCGPWQKIDFFVKYSPVIATLQLIRLTNVFKILIRYMPSDIL